MLTVDTLARSMGALELPLPRCADRCALAAVQLDVIAELIKAVQSLPKRISPRAVLLRLVLERAALQPASPAAGAAPMMSDPAQIR